MNGAITLPGSSNLVYSGLHRGSLVGIGGNQIDNGAPIIVGRERDELAGHDAANAAKTTEEILHDAIRRTGGGMA